MNKGNDFSIFSGLDRILNIVTDMVDNNKDEMNINGIITPDQHKNIVGKYGINIKLGSNNSDSISRTSSLDNLFTKKEDVPKTTEPVTDIFEEESKVTIVSELPGVEKDDIHLRLDKNNVTLTAGKNDMHYSKTITLKFIPDPSKLKESFVNSIYSLELWINE